jgi:hypothetical protein
MCFNEEAANLYVKSKQLYQVLLMPIVEGLASIY